jgi:hypothetical protein
MEQAMARGDTVGADVTFDLVAIRSSTLKAAQSSDQYLRDAENAAPPEVAYFVRQFDGGRLCPRWPL